ncbi:hypothetical protein M885DRAFT_475603 [Pelagophyceae sp. CCMP2097]|nr:hypothetical protein M885DRAFT_475603 [Pelagophyceae sp. CCMP2097]
MAQWVPLVTGGGSGIGLGLVAEFVQRGAAKVLITGRRLEVLEAASALYPGKVFYKQSDAGSAADRTALLAWVEANHPDCNALVNNAGVQRRVSPAEDVAEWAERAMEIEINLSGPIHLCALFVPYLLAKPGPCMVANVSSGLAFVPFAAGPVYSASKAGLHSYTMALRYSLKETHVRIVEIIPPAVKTNLGGSHDFGEECDAFCKHVMQLVSEGHEEAAFNFSEVARTADRNKLDQMMESVAAGSHVVKFKARTE